jgi:hypothetical protein
MFKLEQIPQIKPRLIFIKSLSFSILKAEPIPLKWIIQDSLKDKNWNCYLQNHLMLILWFIIKEIVELKIYQIRVTSKCFLPKVDQVPVPSLLSNLQNQGPLMGFFLSHDPKIILKINCQILWLIYLRLNPINKEDFHKGHYQSKPHQSNS